jgi:hypothetical protein
MRLPHLPPPGSCPDAPPLPVPHQLYDDFSRFPPAEMSIAPQLSADSQQTTVEDGEEELTSEVVHDKTQVSAEHWRACVTCHGGSG